MTETQPLTAAELDEIEARVKAATAGPWTYEEPQDAESANVYRRESYIEGPAGLPITDTLAFEPPDSRFIAAARTDIPRLVARVRELERLNAALCALTPVEMSQGGSISITNKTLAQYLPIANGGAT